MSRLSRRKAASSKRIGRQQKSLSSIYKQQKQAKGLAGVMDFAGSIANLGATLAPNLQEWKEFETGREAVGMERSDTDLNLFDKVGRAFKGPELTGKHDVWGSDAPGGGGALQQGHQYSTAELKRIGMERMAGTERETLGDGQWSDLLGQSMGERMDPSWKPSSGMKASQGINALGTQSDKGKQWLEREGIGQGEFGSSKMGMMEGGNFLDKFQSQLKDMATPIAKQIGARFGKKAYNDLSKVDVVGDIAPEDTTTKANMMLQMDTPATPGSSNLLEEMQKGGTVEQDFETKRIFGKGNTLRNPNMAGPMATGGFEPLKGPDYANESPSFLDVDAFGTGNALQGKRIGKTERPYQSNSDVIFDEGEPPGSMTDESFWSGRDMQNMEGRKQTAEYKDIQSAGYNSDMDAQGYELFTDDDVLGNPEMGELKGHEDWGSMQRLSSWAPMEETKVQQYHYDPREYPDRGTISEGVVNVGRTLESNYAGPLGPQQQTGLGADLQRLGQGAKDVFGGALDMFKNKAQDLGYGFNMWKATRWDKPEKVQY